MCKKLVLQLLFILISAVILVLNAIGVRAESNSSISAASNHKEIYESEMFLEMCDTEYDGAGVLESIAISKNGRYALCFSDVVTHHVNLYDSSCEFLGQYIFHENGALHITFDEGDGSLIVLPIRKHIQIKIDNRGNYISSFEIDNLSDLVDETGALKRFQVSYGEKTYTFYGKKVLRTNSPIFRITDEEGNLLFEYVPSKSYLGTVLTATWIIFVISFLFWVVFIRRRLRK